MMQHSGDEDPALTVQPVEDDMLSFFDPSKPRKYGVVDTSNCRHFSDAFKASDQSIEINIRLLCTPDVGGVVENVGQIAFSQYRQAIKGA